MRSTTLRAVMICQACGLDKIRRLVVDPNLTIMRTAYNQKIHIGTSRITDWICAIVYHVVIFIKLISSGIKAIVQMMTS